MRHYLLIVATCLCLPSLASADGYFGDGTKQLTYKEEGDRSKAQRITLLSLAGATVVVGAVAGYYALDSQSLSDEVSASAIHTQHPWTQDRENTRASAERSAKIAKVSLGISGGFALATIVAYIVTQPSETMGYQDWQAQHALPTITPSAEGLMLAQGWTF